MISLLPRPTQSKFCNWVVYYGLVLFITPPFVHIQASSDASYSARETKLGASVIIPAQENQQARQLEPGKPIERELDGGQSHSYQIALAAGRYARLVVDQRGIDVVAKLFGQDGKQIAEFDSEVRLHGEESVSWVAEADGVYRLDVAAVYENAAAGRYEIQMAESRVATDNDSALHEACRLDTEFNNLYKAAKYDEAILLAERALEIRERVLGPEHFEVAGALNFLGVLYFLKGDYARAERLYQRALVIRETAVGPEHPQVADSISNIAYLYKTRGDYAKAESFYGRALAIREKALGPEHPEFAFCLHNLADLYYLKGAYAKAEQLYQKALIINEKALGPQHPDIVNSLNSLGNLYRVRGDYAKAELFLQRAINIQQISVGLEHPNVAVNLVGLSNLYREKGDYAKAESFYVRALAIREKALGPEHPNVAATLNDFAVLYKTRGDYAKAESFYRRALAIREKALGPEHPAVAASLNNLGNLYRVRGDYAKAELFLQRAIAIQEKSLGPEHPYVGFSLSNVAYLYHWRGDYAKAESLFQRALTIFKNSLGPEYPGIVIVLNDLSMLYAAKGDISQAITFQSRANTIAERNLAFNLSTGSERQKLAYLSLFSAQTDFTLLLHSQAAPNDPQALDLAFTTLLRRKGRGLDSMTDTITSLRRRATPQDQELFDELTQARSQLAAHALKEPDAANPAIYRKRTEELEAEVDKLEAKLSSRRSEIPTPTQPVTLAAVQAALPANSALVEFAVYSSLDPKTGKRNPRYIAYLLPTQGQPKWVDLGEAVLIDHAVDAWRKALRDPNRTDVKRLARALDEIVMRPVRALLRQLRSDERHLLIAPDGSLNLIPFAALVDERNSYLVESYSITYLTSGRDLLGLQTSQPSKSAPLVLANPLFGAGKTAASTPLDQNPADSPASDQPGNEAPERNDSRAVFFQALPGTRREALAIKALLPEASLLLRDEATEAALKEVHAPSILHIATHGFFLEDQEAPPPNTRGLFTDNPLRASDPRLMKWAAKIENPLLRSGLALAGVNQHRGGDDDGLLTALETASLDLWGTKLVVLSACDTGMGKVMNGEGVYGLRRALVLAGSQTQVMSLWTLSDREARKLMAGYYRRLMKGEGRGEALRQIQLEMLKGAELRHPYYWASFIQAGEWANLDGKR